MAITRKEKALNRKIDWNTAIAEGRVMRSQGGLSMASFATRADALQAVARCQMAGLEADILDPSLADRDYVDVRHAVRQQFPDAYFVAGVGWCGPHWESAATLEQSLLRTEQS